jgi:hypothetical protein
MSYIDKPNIRGLGCDFVPQGVWQPYTNLMDPPNMPNYGLGVDTAHGCWPLGHEVIVKPASEFVIYPNPASHTITLESTSFQHHDNSIEVMNMLGDVVYRATEKATSSSQLHLDVSSFPKGVYMIRVNEVSRKLVVE